MRGRTHWVRPLSGDASVSLKAYGFKASRPNPLQSVLMNIDSSPIAAIATAPGRGGIGVVRASGKNLQPLIAALFGACLLYTSPSPRDRG